MFNNIKYSYEKNPRTGGKSGFFLNSGSSSWEEWQEEYPVFYFRELSRSNGVIYLYDQSRKIHVSIPERGGVARFKYDNTRDWEFLFNVKKSTETKLTTGLTVMYPWKDPPSDRWAIIPLDISVEIVPIYGNLTLKFQLWNKDRASNRRFNAIYSGPAVGLSAGINLSLNNQWQDFGTAGKVPPSEFNGLGAEVRSLGASVLVGYNRTGIKLPNVDTSPARPAIGGFTASAGGLISVFVSGGEFRVLPTLVANA
jgi:hypothetical protein